MLKALFGNGLTYTSIGTAPTRDRVDGYPPRTRRRDGIDVVESVTITGMAHGTPLATGSEGCGKAGAFLLDVGISSSGHIAKFFGLTGAAHARAGTLARETTIAPAPPVADDVEIIPDEQVEILDVDSKPKFESATDGRIDVMAVITKALTSAGLMKPPR